MYIYVTLEPDWNEGWRKRTRTAKVILANISLEAEFIKLDSKTFRGMLVIVVGSFVIVPRGTFLYLAPHSAEVATGLSLKWTITFGIGTAECWYDKLNLLCVLGIHMRRGNSISLFMTLGVESYNIGLLKSRWFNLVEIYVQKNIPVNWSMTTS